MRKWGYTQFVTISPGAGLKGGGVSIKTKGWNNAYRSGDCLCEANKKEINFLKKKAVYIKDNRNQTQNLNILQIFTQ